MLCFHIHTALGQSEILQFFLNTLEEKNDIDVLDHIHATPAHDAAEYGQKEAMILLLKHGANVNIKDTVSFIWISQLFMCEPLIVLNNATIIIPLH